MVITPNVSSASPEFRDLVNAINLLKTELLPEDLENDDFSLNYPQLSDSELSQLSTRAKAFVALCHAEIEDYVEKMAIRIKAYAINEWHQREAVSIPLLALIVFVSNQKTYEFQKATNEINNYMKETIDRVNSSFSNIVHNNHGIREANLYSLLVPIGLKIDVFDNPWIQEIELFAKNRGEIVHKSRNASTSQPVNPKDKLEQVHRILYGKDLSNRTVYKGLVDIDQELLHLCQ